MDNLFAGLDKRQAQTAKRTVSDILFVIVKYARDNRVQIGTKQIARESGHSEKHVKKWLKRLREEGILTIIQQAVWKCRTTEYLWVRGALSLIHESEGQPNGCQVCVSSLFIDGSDSDSGNEKEANKPALRSNALCTSTEGAPCTKSYLLDPFDDIPYEPKSQVVRCPPILKGLDLSDEERKAYRREKRLKERQKVIKEANKLLAQTWEIVSKKQFPIPLHPDFLRYRLMTDEEKERFRARWGFHPVDQFFVFDADDEYRMRGKLAYEYRFLPQPDVNDRPKCRCCGRAMYLVVIERGPAFGALRYHCRNKSVFHNVNDRFADVWRKYPVFPRYGGRPLRGDEETTESRYSDQIIARN